MKKCCKCKTEKQAVEFYHRSDKPHLLMSRCKPCICEDTKEDAMRSPTKKLRDREYYSANKERRNAYMKEWQKRNKHLRYSKDKEKCLRDVHFAMRQRLHNRLRTAIRRNPKHTSVVVLLGCSLQEFKVYFESRFSNGMTWEAFSRGEIHIDHIITCALFDLSQEEQQRKCFHYTNLQPLYAKDNMSKGKKVEVSHR